MISRRTKISPKSGRGLGHVTSTIFGSTVGYPSDSLASCLYFSSFARAEIDGAYKSPAAVYSFAPDADVLIFIIMRVQTENIKNKNASYRKRIARSASAVYLWINLILKNEVRILYRCEDV